MLCAMCAIFKGPATTRWLHLFFCSSPVLGNQGQPLRYTCLMPITSPTWALWAAVSGAVHDGVPAGRAATAMAILTAMMALDPSQQRVPDAIMADDVEPAPPGVEPTRVRRHERP